MDLRHLVKGHWQYRERLTHIIQSLGLSSGVPLPRPPEGYSDQDTLGSAPSVTESVSDSVTAESVSAVTESAPTVTESVKTAKGEKRSCLGFMLEHMEDVIDALPPSPAATTTASFRDEVDSPHPDKVEFPHPNDVDSPHSNEVDSRGGCSGVMDVTGERGDSARGAGGV